MDMSQKKRQKIGKINYSLKSIQKEVFYNKSSEVLEQVVSSLEKFKVWLDRALSS